MSQLAEKVGVALGTIGAWESGRKVPPARIPALTAALAEAELVSHTLHRQEAARMSQLVALHPGQLTMAELRHRLRKQSAGVQRFGGMRARALRFAIRTGTIFEAEVVVTDSQGRLRHRRVLFPAGHESPPQETMTGDELWEIRQRAGWTQGDLAEHLGVSKTLVSKWERRHELLIPGGWAARIRGLEGDPTITSPSDYAERKVVDVVRSVPGVPLWRLLALTDHGALIRRTIGRLRATGDIVAAPAFDSLGRKYVGFYLRDHEFPTPLDFEDNELRELRRSRGLTAGALADVIGVRRNTLTRWETGARRCPPDRAAQLRTVLKSRPPS